jgi:ABC-type transport system substrate-binding protein
MSKSSRYFVRLILAFINRFKLIFLVGIVIGILSFVVLTILIPHLPRVTSKIGVVGEYSTDNLPTSITNMIGIGLTRLDKSGQAIPAIAERWVASDSGKVWTFYLNKNVKWQDGTSITSKDINYNFSDVVVTKPDKYTIAFKLKTPLADFPVILSKPIFKQGLLGVGQWRVTGLTLTGNFIETLTVVNNLKDQIIFDFYPTESRAKLAFELGEVQSVNDLIDPVPFSTWKTAKVTGTTDEP